MWLYDAVARINWYSTSFPDLHEDGVKSLSDMLNDARIVLGWRSVDSL